MKSNKNIERLIEHFCVGKKARVKTTTKLDERIVNDALLNQEYLKKTQSAVSQPSIWRIIVKNNTKKIVAAAFIVALFVGIYQIDSARAAFTRTTKMLSTGLAGLKAFILDMKTREPEQPSVVPPADSNEQGATYKGQSILANVYTFSVEANQGDLQKFFEAESIEWAPTWDNSNTWYAELDPDKTKILIGLSNSAIGIKLKSSPGLMVREGEEGIIGIAGSEEQDNVALALVATVPDDSESIDLSLSFLNGQSGFEISSIRIDKDDAVLFRLLDTASSPDEQNEQDDFYEQDYRLVLVKVKVFP